MTPARLPAPLGRARNAIPPKPSTQAGHRRGREPLAVDDAVEQRHPERHRADDQGYDPRVDVLNRVGDAAVAQEQERAADGERGAPVHEARALRATGGDEVENGARDEEADGEHQERGQGLDGEVDRQVGRAPDDVDDRKGRPHASGGRVRAGHLDASACGRAGTTRAGRGRRSPNARLRGTTAARQRAVKS